MVITLDILRQALESLNEADLLIKAAELEGDWPYDSPPEMQQRLVDSPVIDCVRKAQHLLAMYLGEDYRES